MTHPFHEHRHISQGHKRAEERLRGHHAHGGGVHGSRAEASETHAVDEPEVPKLKRGGETEGHKTRRRLDRGGRSGGKHGKGSHVMINIAPGAGQDRPVPVPMPAGPPAMPPPGPPMPPRPPMAGPPGMPPGMPPPGMPPGGMPMRAAGGRVGRKHGGRAKRQMGGTLPAAMAVPAQRPAVAPAAAGLARPVVPAGMGAVPPSAAMGLRHRGGRTKHADGGAVAEAGEPHAENEPKMPHMMAGARSALGRMERSKAAGGFRNERAAGD